MHTIELQFPSLIPTRDLLLNVIPLSLSSFSPSLSCTINCPKTDLKEVRKGQIHNYKKKHVISTSALFNYIVVTGIAHMLCLQSHTDQSGSFSVQICSAYNGKIKLTGSEEELLWKENVTSAIWRYFGLKKKIMWNNSRNFLSKWRLRKRLNTQYLGSYAAFFCKLFICHWWSSLGGHNTWRFRLSPAVPYPTVQALWPTSRGH